MVGWPRNPLECSRNTPAARGSSNPLCATGFVVAACRPDPAFPIHMPQCLITKLLSETSKTSEVLGDESVMISDLDKIPPGDLPVLGASFTRLVIGFRVVQCHGCQFLDTTIKIFWSK